MTADASRTTGDLAALLIAQDSCKGCPDTDCRSSSHRRTGIRGRVFLTLKQHRTYARVVNALHRTDVACDQSQATTSRRA